MTRMVSRNFHFWILLMLGSLFVLRVLAQLLQAIHPVGVLPAFDAWQGSATAYPVLLSTQIAIVAILAGVLWRVGTHSVSPRRWKYRLCFASGGVYFTSMAFRFVAGLTVFSDVTWFSRIIPAFFHMVLATFLLTLGLYIYRNMEPESHG